MLKLLQTTALLFFTASLAAATHFTLKNSLEKQGGEGSSPLSHNCSSKMTHCFSQGAATSCA